MGEDIVFTWRDLRRQMKCLQRLMGLLFPGDTVWADGYLSGSGQRRDFRPFSLTFCTLCPYQKPWYVFVLIVKTHDSINLIIFVLHEKKYVEKFDSEQLTRKNWVINWVFKAPRTTSMQYTMVTEEWSSDSNISSSNMNTWSEELCSDFPSDKEEVIEILRNEIRAARLNRPYTANPAGPN